MHKEFLSSKVIKKFTYIAVAILTKLIFLVILLFIILNSSVIQNYAIKKITNIASNKLGTKVEIDHFSTNFFSHINLKKIYIEDLNSDTLLHCEELNISFKLIPLFKKTLEIRNIQLQQPKIYLNRDNASQLNIHFIIDALSPDSVVENKITYNIQNIKIKNGILRFISAEYDGNDETQMFNPNNIYIDNLNCNASFMLKGKNTISVSLDKLNFKEKSGFAINSLSTAFNASDTKAAIPYFKLNTDNSTISMDSIYLKYDSISTLRTDFKNTACNFTINPSHISPIDFKYFNSIIGNFKDTLLLQGGIKGTIGNIKTENLVFSYGKDLSLSGNVEAIGLPDINNTFFYGNIDLKFNKYSLQDLIGNTTRQATQLPQELNNLGLCVYKGNITGFIDDMVLYGNLRSNAGTIQTDVQIKVAHDYSNVNVKGSISSSGVDLSKVLPNSELGRVSFAVNTDLLLKKDNKFESNSKLYISSINYKNYTYKGIKIEGTNTNTFFSGKFHIDDPNAYVDFEGSVNYNTPHKNFNFITEIKHLNLSQLNLIDGYEDMNLSGKIDADFYGPKWENMNGQVTIDSILIERTNDNFLIQQTKIKANNETSKFINISGDMINGDIFGTYSFATFPQSFLSILSNQLPILNNKFNIKNYENNQFSFYIDINSTKQLCNILDIPWYTNEPTNIQGQFNDIKNDFYTEISIPNISNGKTNINNFNIYCDNNQSLNFKLQANTKLKHDTIFASISINSLAGEILSSFKFDNKKDSNIVAGEVVTKISFLTYPDSQTTKITILPSSFIIKDNYWDINYSHINIKEGLININEFLAQGGEEQSISINGDITASANDSLEIILNKINLDHISDLLPEETAIHFGGTVTGAAHISNTLTSQPIIEADVVASNFMFNKSYFGLAKATSNFDIENNCLVFKGDVKDDYNTTTALLDGKYFLLKDSLDIKGDAYNLNMNFLDYYLAGILDNIKGQATGKVHIHGFTKTQTVAVDAKAYIENAQVSIGFLNSTFFFSDTIEMDKSKILLKNINLVDLEGNSAKLNGEINHTYFKNIQYYIDIAATNILTLNTTAQNSDTFYGKAYATGNVIISGNEQIGTTISCKVITNNNTKVSIPIDSYYASDNSFITFINPNSEEEKQDIPIKSTGSNIFLDIMLDVTPTAEIDLLINSKTGDIIRAKGNGNLRITYDMNNNDMKMYGTYSITEGSYLFTFQNALNKQFTINNGSTIFWAGSPTNAKIDIKAYHQLSASLGTILDENVLSSSSRTSVPVQCILNLSGNMMQPNINFDIKLPNSAEEVSRALKNIINTQELMNRQTVSLLVLGSFMSPDFMNDNNANTQNKLYSVMSSTLSSVLNSWASQLFDKWNFGINYHPGNEGINADEYEFNFLYTPNNRLTINGNLGYKNDVGYKNDEGTNNFIGDFDLEYKLIESGKLSAKVYTHTNDYNEYKQSFTTQGAGIVYRESFNNVKELWKGWRDNAKMRKEKWRKKKDMRKAKKEAMKNTDVSEK